jgi:hypothetical protein
VDATGRSLNRNLGTERCPKVTGQACLLAAVAFTGSTDQNYQVVGHGGKPSHFDFSQWKEGSNDAEVAGTPRRSGSPSRSEMLYLSSSCLAFETVDSGLHFWSL